LPFAYCLLPSLLAVLGQHHCLFSGAGVEMSKANIGANRPKRH